MTVTGHRPPTTRAPTDPRRSTPFVAVVLHLVTFVTAVVLYPVVRQASTARDAARRAAHQPEA